MPKIKSTLALIPRKELEERFMALLYGCYNQVEYLKELQKKLKESDIPDIDKNVIYAAHLQTACLLVDLLKPHVNLFPVKYEDRPKILKYYDYLLKVAIDNKLIKEKKYE